MSLLHIDSIRKEFGQKVVLSDVFLQCNRGEIIGLLGRNGSGKSTLLQIIFGSLYTQSRFVKIDHHVSQNLSDNRNTLVYLPQFSFLPSNSRIRSLTKFLLNKEGEAKLECHFKQIFSINPRIRELSEGEKRIFEILLLIFSSASYILLDEPFTGLAPIQKDLIKTLVKDESRNKGFIITDHDYRNIMEISHRLILLKDGRTIPVKADELKHYGYIP